MAKTASARTHLLRAALGGLFAVVALVLVTGAVSHLNPQGRATLAGAICGGLAAIPTTLASARRSRRNATPPRHTRPVEVVFIAPTSRLEAFGE
jgi:hypothetical protein